MVLVKEGKTNWKYVSIVAILAILVVGGIITYSYWWLQRHEAKLSEEPAKSSKKCYEEITNVTCPHGPACMPDPASAFCECMGGKISIEDTSEGQRGLCTIDGKTYDEWKYFNTMKP